MEKNNINEFIKGWFIGNFEPSIFKTTQFEVAVKKYKKGAQEKPHYHKIAREFTMILRGKVKINGKVFKSGDIVQIDVNETSLFEVLKKTTTLVIKIPSINNDKFLIDEKRL